MLDLVVLILEGFDPWDGNDDIQGMNFGSIFRLVESRLHCLESIAHHFHSLLCRETCGFGFGTNSCDLGTGGFDLLQKGHIRSLLMCGQSGGTLLLQCFVGLMPCLSALLASLLLVPGKAGWWGCCAVVGAIVGFDIWFWFLGALTGVASGVAGAVPLWLVIGWFCSLC